MSKYETRDPARHDRASSPARARWLVAAVGMAAIAAAQAALPLKTIEECLETGTEAISLPGIAGGSLSASPCASCPGLRLRFGDRTRYYIGKQTVTYTKFREAAAKGDLRLDLFYEPKTRTLTKLRIPAASASK